MKSQRVLVKIADAGDWRGDDLRFRPGCGDALARAQDLLGGYKHIVDWCIVDSEDEPTHGYRVDGSLCRMSEAAPARYEEFVDPLPAPKPFTVVELPHPEEERRVPWIFVLAVFAAGAWLVVWMRNFQVP